MQQNRFNFMFVFLCWLCSPLVALGRTISSRQQYEYYSARISSVSVDIGGIFKEYNTESTSRNVRRNTETNVWEVFRKKYGPGGDTDYHEGVYGTWEILDADNVEIMTKKGFLQTPQLLFD